MWFFGSRRKRQADAEAARASKSNADIIEQHRLGERLFNLAVVAAAENLYRNDHHKIVVNKIAGNGGPRGDYSIFVYVRDSVGDHFMMQVDIRVPRDEIHWLMGKYGPEDYYTIGQFGAVAHAVCEKIKVLK